MHTWYDQDMHTRVRLRVALSSRIIFAFWCVCWLLIEPSPFVCTVVAIPPFSATHFLLRLFSTRVAEPIAFGRARETDTAIVEPLNRAIFVLTCNHLAKGHAFAHTVSGFVWIDLQICRIWQQKAPSVRSGARPGPTHFTPTLSPFVGATALPVCCLKLGKVGVQTANSAVYQIVEPVNNNNNSMISINGRKRRQNKAKRG